MEKTDKRAVTIASAMMLVAVLGNLLLSEIASFAISAGLSETVAVTLLTILFEGIFLAVPALAAKDGARRAAPTVGQFLKSVFLGVALVFALNLVSALWALLLERCGIPESAGGIAPARDTVSLMGQVLLVGALPGICEELFFREYLLGRLERAGTKKALILSSLLFALLHGDLWGFPAYLLAGLALGSCAIATGSVYVPMMAHTTYNSAICILSFLQRDLEDVGTVTEYVAQSGGISPFLFSLLLYGAFALFLLRSLSRGGRKTAMPSAKMPLAAALLLSVTGLALAALIVYGMGVFG